MNRTGRKLGGVWATAIALIGVALALLVGASQPAVAAKPTFEMTKPHMAFHAGLGVLADGSLEVQHAHGTITVPPSVGSSSQGVWRVSDEELPSVVGYFVNPVFLQELTIKASPTNPPAEGVNDPGAITVVVVPAEPTEPCVSGRGSLGTATITYDDREARVDELAVAVRMACHRAADTQRIMVTVRTPTSQ